MFFMIGRAADMPNRTTPASKRSVSRVAFNAETGSDYENNVMFSLK